MGVIKGVIMMVIKGVILLPLPLPYPLTLKTPLPPWTILSQSRKAGARTNSASLSGRLGNWTTAGPASLNRMLRSCSLRRGKPQKAESDTSGPS